MAKVTFDGFVSAEITSNIDRALPVCVKKASEALLKSDASLTNYLTFFKQCDIEDEMYRATKGSGRSSCTRINFGFNTISEKPK